METKTKVNSVSTPDERLRQLIERAISGDRSVLPALREFLDSSPDVWREVGDVAKQAERAWSALAAGSNLVTNESIKRQLTSLRAELMGSNPSALERLVVGQVALGWLEVNYSGTIVAQNIAKGSMGKGVDFLQRLHDCAHRRYLASIKTLAVLRKLLSSTGKPVQQAESGGNVDKQGDRTDPYFKGSRRSQPLKEKVLRARPRRPVPAVDLERVGSFGAS